MKQTAKLLAALLLLSFAGASQLVARSEGYVKVGDFDLMPVLQPAPSVGSIRYEMDRQVFRQTRSLQDTPRWTMAVNDVHTDTTSLMHDFSCAVGLNLSVDAAPALTRLLSRASTDTRNQTNSVKDRFKRLRPFLIDQGPICEPASDVAGTFDYPSGHTTLGWTWATILAELVPERAQEILSRGRAYGESRIVCGVHNASAVEAGRLSAASTLSVVRASAEYQSDFRLAQEEMRDLKRTLSAPSPEICSTNQKLVNMNILKN
jgi:acid phosphatase (class A)